MGRLDLMEDFIAALGLVMVLEGLPWLISPQRMRATFASLMQLPDATLHKMGVALIATGLLTLYVVRG
ncbi:MAG: DUF2065 domain-containing protein [Alphaproteobacteria bacterium CG_4_10_14_0_2_um_filter_63_37]|nr:MAG: DUF2065 domain-containing protein [Alphaproteobacteria bacterium CG_4_10_14_0_2_um_filter_63_37]